MQVIRRYELSKSFTELKFDAEDTGYSVFIVARYIERILEIHSLRLAQSITQ